MEYVIEKVKTLPKDEREKELHFKKICSDIEAEKKEIYGSNKIHAFIHVLKKKNNNFINYFL